MNVQQQIIVALGPAYAGKRGGGVIAGFHEAHLLDTGAIAIFDEENNLLQTTSVVADLVKVQKFFFAQGGVDQASSPKLSYMIDRNAFTQWYTTYEAPVLQVSKIGKVATVGTLNLPGTLVAGTFATVNVVNKPSIGYTPNMIKRYSVPVAVADTATTLLAKLVALINADPDAIVVATQVNDASNDALVLTAKAAGIGFKLGVDDVLVSATRSENGPNGSTNNFSGFGTLANLKKNIMEDQLTRGDAYTMHVGYNSYVEVTDGLSSGNFNCWTFQWKEEAHRATDVLNTSTPVVGLYILTTATGLANINTILAIVLGVPDTGSGGSGSGESSGEGVTVDDFPAGGVG